MPVIAEGTPRASPSRAMIMKSKLLDFIAPLDMGRHPTQTPRLNIQRHTALERVSHKRSTSKQLRSASNQTPPLPLLPNPSFSIDDTRSPSPNLLKQAPKIAQVPFPTPPDHVHWAPLQTRPQSQILLSSMSIETAATSGTPTTGTDKTALNTPHHAVPRHLKSSSDHSTSDMRRAYYAMRSEYQSHPVAVWGGSSSEAPLVPASLSIRKARQTSSKYAEHTTIAISVNSKPIHAQQQKSKEKQSAKHKEPLPQPPLQPWISHCGISLEVQRRKLGLHVPESLPIGGSSDQDSTYLRWSKYRADNISTSTASGARSLELVLDPEVAVLMNEAERMFEMKDVDFVLPELDMGAELRELFGEEWAVFEESK